MNVDDPLDDVSFPLGSIEKVIFKDFLTYSHATLTAGKNLNLIIGVNGSGKSTVICGICLAVGGSPKNLGRSESIGDFIRHGKNIGSVEVFLSDPNKSTQSLKLVITREGPAAKAHAEYFINGLKVAHRAVKEMAVHYNIQIDNPCTFLAQDKVKGFSEQDAKELLLNTERAADQKLIEQHEKLIQRREEHKDMDKNRAHSEKQLRDVSSSIEGLRPRVENYRKQQAQNSKIKALSQRQKVLEFDDVFDIFKKKDRMFKLHNTLVRKATLQAEEQKQRHAKLEKRLDDIQNQEVPKKKQVRELNLRLADEVRHNSYKRALAQADNDLKLVEAQASNYEEEGQKIRDDLQNLNVRHERARRELMSSEHNVAAAGMSINNERHRIQEAIDSYGEKIDQLTAKRNRILRQKQELRYNYQENQSPFDDKIRFLRGELKIQGVQYPGWEFACAAQVWDYLERNDLGITVHVPFFEIVMRKENAKYLEALVAHRDMTMFIFETQDDESRIRQKFPKMNSTVLTHRNVNKLHIQARLPSQLQSYGFNKFAIQLIEDAPDVVLQYLCNVSRLNRIPIGDGQTDLSDNAVRNLQQSGYFRFINGHQLSDVKISKYSGETITSGRPLRPARLFILHNKPVDVGSGLDAQRTALEQSEVEIGQELETIQLNQDEKIKAREEILKSVNEHKALRDREASLRSLVQSKQDALYYHERIKPDLDAARGNYELSTTRAAEKTLNVAMENMRQLKNRLAIILNTKLVQLSVGPLRKKKDEFYRQVLKMQHIVDKKKAKAAVTTREMDTIKERMNEAQEELMNYCGIPTMEPTKLIETQKAAYDRMLELFEEHNVNTMKKGEVDKMLAEEQANKRMRANDGSAQDVELYKTLRKDKERLEKLVQSQSGDLQAITDVLQNDINAWQEPVEKLVTEINAKYHAYFRQIGDGCCGAVELDIPIEPLNIAEYGIRIMVSFRKNEKVRRLDHQVQSGGERSVSTMLYLLALQEFCPVPFRCVDEINQGMDPTNERRVFDIMVKMLTGCGNLAKSQYFLLTPKLLHNLSFNDKVTVQCVHNSRALTAEANTWDPRDYLQKLKRSH